MFEQLVICSDATRRAAQEGGREAGLALIPALCGCQACGTARLIAAPILGACSDCGGDLAILNAPVHANGR